MEFSFPSYRAKLANVCSVFAIRVRFLKNKKVLERDQFKSAKLESRPIAPVIREFICEAEEVWSKNGGAEVAKEEAT